MLPTFNPPAGSRKSLDRRYADKRQQGDSFFDQHHDQRAAALPAKLLSKSGQQIGDDLTVRDDSIRSLELIENFS